jgi:hypothetical protein
MLNRYLDGLTSYAETVVWSGHDSDTNCDSNNEGARESTEQALDPLHGIDEQQENSENAVSRDRDQSESVPLTAQDELSDSRGKAPLEVAEDRPVHAIEMTFATGTYLLGKTIGQGAVGKVKLAKHEETGEQVSTKQSRLKSSLQFDRNAGRHQDHSH